MLRGFGVTYKKDLQVLEQKQPDVRRIWTAQHQPFMCNLLPRLGFIDETALKKMDKTIGWSPKGTRLINHAALRRVKPPKPSSPPCAVIGWKRLG
jgi:hypothetical protein